MSDFTQEQLEFIHKHAHRFNCDNWRVLSDTDTELVLLHKRGRRRTIKKDGGVNSDL